MLFLTQTEVIRSFTLWITLCLSTLGLGACGSVPIEQAREAYHRGEFQQASSILSSDEIRSKDRLLALMEKGAIWHEAGDYSQSSEALLEAVKLLESTDFVSVREKATSLTINEWTTTYRGETAERLWIHTYQIMNFLLLDKHESAAVEARQALVLLDKHDKELEADYFTRALLATAFDSINKPNDAYIEYRKLSQLLPTNKQLASLRDERARRAGIPIDSKSIAAGESAAPPGSEGELLVFVASGQIPEKISNDIVLYPGERISFPVYDINRFTTPQLTVSTEIQSTPINDLNLINTDLGQVARTALAARGARTAAKHIARSSVKNALVHATEHESASAAALLEVVFFALEVADTRGWATLPAHLSLLRIPLPSGTHAVTIRNTAVGSDYELNGVVIKPGSVVYRRIRL